MIGICSAGRYLIIALDCSEASVQLNSKPPIRKGEGEVFNVNK